MLNLYLSITFTFAAVHYTCTPTYPRARLSTSGSCAFETHFLCMLSLETRKDTTQDASSRDHTLVVTSRCGCEVFTDQNAACSKKFIIQPDCRSKARIKDISNIHLPNAAKQEPRPQSLPAADRAAFFCSTSSSRPRLDNCISIIVKNWTETRIQHIIEIITWPTINASLTRLTPRETH